MASLTNVCNGSSRTTLTTPHTGLQWLAEHLGFTLEECVAFGDSSNDFEMLRDAGFGVCMDNGRDEVKAVSNKVSAWSNDEDGVGREIELLLEQGAFD